MLRTADGDVILFDARQAKAQATLVRSLAIERLLSGGAGTGRRAITSIACGADHSLALSADGALFTWGDGGFGCLGHGDLADDEGEVKVPRLVVALSSHRVLSISASGRHCACVVAGDQHGSRGGSVWTWGRGNNGRLGHGSTTPSDASVPTRIREFAPRASDVAQTVTRAIRSGGLVSDVRFPKVIGRLHRSVFIGSEAVDLVIASGAAQSRAAAVAVLARLLSSGVFSAAPPPHSGAACFKDDYSFYRFASDRGSGGDVVDGSSSGGAARRATAASDGGASAVAQVTCGWNFTLFLTLDGAVYACGRGVEGQCGVEPARDCFEPTPLAPIERRAPLSIAQTTTPPRVKNKHESASAQLRYGDEGGGSGRATSASGSGDELSGSLLAEFESAARAEMEERDSRGLLLSPADASPGSSPAKRGRAGAVFDPSSGGASAAGSPLQRRQRAASAEASAERFVGIAAGYSYALALTTEGVIFSWGSGDFGQLGTLTVSAPLPQRVPLSSVLEDGDVVEAVSAGLYHAAARTIRGRVLVWGLNKDGRLGLGDCRDRVVPTAVPREWLGPRRSVSSVSCAANSTIFVHDETLQDGRTSPSFEVLETVPMRAASGSVRYLLFTVTFNANYAHHLTLSP
jgi:alpha-tubulin suppressor-like RCC1 family protein